MTSFFDTSAVISLVDPHEPHHQWSLEQLAACKGEGPVIIADIVYSELSAGMKTKEDVDTIINRFAFERIGRDDVALFSAGQAYKLYKSRAGTKTNVLADFLIGAAAETEGAPIITANPKDFRKYFKGLKVVCPA